MNVALIGLGRWGRVLGGAIARAGWNLVSTYDIDGKGNSTSAEQAIGGNGVEAVVIATPPDTHASLTRMALRCRRHVLCEKPLAFTASECRELGDLAVGCGRTLMVDYLPLFLDEVEEIPAGSWRDASECVFIRHTDTPPRDTRLGPMLWDLSVHDLALADYLIGPLPAIGWRRTRATAEVVYPCGPLVSFYPGYGKRVRSAFVRMPNGDARELSQSQNNPEPLLAVLSAFRRVVKGEEANRAGAELSARIARALSP